MPDGIQSTAAMDAWLRMLDQVQESIDGALRETDAHERSLADAEAAPPGTAWPDAQRHYLDQLDERLRGLDEHLQAAGRLAEAIEGLLADDEREARAFVGQAEAVRQRLAAPNGIS
jgi:hypothetical protein